jgi:hypothetical protein
VLEKQSKGICLITINVVTYHLVAHILAIQFKDILADHFNPHQFGVATYGGCEIMVHDVQAMLDLHPHWVVLQVDVHTTFNSMS